MPRCVLLGLVFLAVVGPWVKDLSAQPASRIALTAAIVDHGSIRLDRYDGVLGVDRVEWEGHLYSDKAPGQPALAAPTYALARAAGAEPADRLRVRGNLTLWWVTFWSSAVPGAILVALVALLVPATARGGLAAVVGIAFGTLLLPFSSELYGHVLATCLAVGGWLVVRRPGPRVRAGIAGALFGLAVLVEYQMVLFLVAVAAFLALRREARDVLVFLAAAATGTGALLVYQGAVFGHPLRTSYGANADGNTLPGIPDPFQAIEVLFGIRGVLVFTPIVGFAVVGLVLLARGERGAVRDEAIFGLVLFAGFLALQASWPNPWGGEMPGPRYLIPALPLLAAGIPPMWQRAPALGRALLLWSVVAMSLPLITLHLVPRGQMTVEAQVNWIREIGVSPTIWTMAFGGVGWVVHGASVALLLVLLHRSYRPAGE